MSYKRTIDYKLMICFVAVSASIGCGEALNETSANDAPATTGTAATEGKGDDPTEQRPRDVTERDEARVDRSAFDAHLAAIEECTSSTEQRRAAGGDAEMALVADKRECMEAANDNLFEQIDAARDEASLQEHGSLSDIEMTAMIRSLLELCSFASPPVAAANGDPAELEFERCHAESVWTSGMLAQEVAGPEPGATLLTAMVGPNARRAFYGECYEPLDAALDAAGAASTDEEAHEIVIAANDEVVQCMADRNLEQAPEVARELIDGGHSETPQPELEATIRDRLTRNEASSAKRCAALTGANPDATGLFGEMARSECEQMTLAWVGLRLAGLE